MSLKTIWIDTLYKVATGSRNVRNFFTPIGAIVYGLLILVFVVIALYVDRLIGLPNIFPYPLNLIISIPIFFTRCVFNRMVGSKFSYGKGYTGSFQSSA